MNNDMISSLPNADMQRASEALLRSAVRAREVPYQGAMA